MLALKRSRASQSDGSITQQNIQGNLADWAATQVAMAAHGQRLPGPAYASFSAG